jgi:hypothetical protein
MKSQEMISITSSAKDLLAQAFGAGCMGGPAALHATTVEDAIWLGAVAPRFRGFAQASGRLFWITEGLLSDADLAIGGTVGTPADVGHDGTELSLLPNTLAIQPAAKSGGLPSAGSSGAQLRPILLSVLIADV